MFLCDLHTHTCFSFDGAPEATHDAMCRRALEVGLTDIAFTDHCDINGEVEGIYTPFRADEAFAAAQAVKEKYRGRLNVICGIELGNATQYPIEAAAALAAHPYEFVIGSLHNLAGVPDFSMLKYEMMSDALIHRLFDRALTETVNMIEQFPGDGTRGDGARGYTTIGHITYMHRYVTLAKRPLDFKPHREKLEYLYRSVIARDIAIEINVSTLWRGLGISMPTLELLKFYRDCGGKLVTVGSDAHAPENLGKAIRKGYALLGAAGFTEVLSVADGERVMRSIE